MQTIFFEATNDNFNWGKFAVGVFDREEWSRPSLMPVDDEFKSEAPLLRQVGWTPGQFIWVLDLQTGEGAYFRHGGHAEADLNKHRIWVCPLYEGFLCWLYAQDLQNLDELPRVVNLSQEEAPPALYGYRRPGPG